MKKLNKKGFTLVEMLVVIAIIAVLVAIIIPTVSTATSKAKAATDAANLRSAEASVQVYLLANGIDVSKGTANQYDAPNGSYDSSIVSKSGDGSITVKYGAGKVTAYFGTDATKNVSYYASMAGNS